MRAAALHAAGAWLAVHIGVAAAQDSPPVAIYDCSWVAAAAPIQCTPSDDALQRLVHAADIHQMASHFGPREATWAQMLAAVRGGRTNLHRDRLTFRERVVAQNAALRIARTVASYGASVGSALTRELLQESGGLIAWLAFPPDRLGSADVEDEIAAWVGPRPAWVEERLEGDPPLLHEMIYLETRAFRMVRVGEDHFIFSQLVAIDSAWRPHVTPVVGDIEMRRDAGASPSACVVEFDPAWARCGAPAGLRAIDRLPMSHLSGYVEAGADGRANCLSCHRGGRVLGRTLLALPAEEIEEHLARRRVQLLTRLAAELAPIRAAATDRSP